MPDPSRNRWLPGVNQGGNAVCNTPEAIAKRARTASVTRMLKRLAREPKTERQIKQTLRQVLTGEPTALWLETLKYVTDHVDGKAVQRVEMDTPQTVVFEFTATAEPEPDALP